jgi:hypothetical protein
MIQSDENVLNTIAGSIPDEVKELHYGLGFTQPLAEMSTRNLPGGKGGRSKRKAQIS